MAEISGQDTAVELPALKATTKAQDANAKAQDAKIKELSAQLRGDTSGAKRARNGAPVEKKPIPGCTVCGERGHNAVDCWDQLDADQANSTRLGQGGSRQEEGGHGQAPAV